MAKKQKHVGAIINN